MQLASCPEGLDSGEVIANICPTLLVGREEKRVALGPTLRSTIVNVSFQGFWMTEFHRAGGQEGDKFWIPGATEVRVLSQESGTCAPT